MNKREETALLNNIYRNAEMGRDGLYYVLRKTDHIPMRRAVGTQLLEYQSIMDEAGNRLGRMGQYPHSNPPMAKMMVRMSAAGKMARDNSPAAMADMLIQGSSMGVTKITRQMHQCADEPDNKSLELARRLQQTERNNIHKLQQYL